MDHGPRECFVLYPLDGDGALMMRIPEDCLPIARRQGWLPFLRESEIPAGAHDPVDPSHSSRTIGEDEQC